MDSRRGRMEALAQRSPRLCGVVGAWTERGARSLARGARAAFALILLAAAAFAQVPTAEELWTELAEEFASGRYEQVVARWQAVGEKVDATENLWPYAALTAAESMLRLGRWQEVQRLLDDLALRPQLPMSVDCHRAAMVGRLYLLEGRYDLARQPIARALELSRQVRELGEWAWSTVGYTRLRAVELAHALEQHAEVERLVESFLADEELYAADPELKAEMLFVCGIAQEQREIDDPNIQPLALTTFLRAEEELRAIGASAERDRLRVQVQLALARQALASGELDSAGERLAVASRVLKDGERGGTLNERTVLATLQAQHARARGADRAFLERARDELAQAYAGSVERLKGMPERPGGLGLLHYVELRAPLLELVALDFALEDDVVGGARALERALDLQALGSLARTLQAPVPTLAEVRRALLSDDRGLLLFLLTDRRSLVLAVDRERVTCTPVAGLNLLERTSARYRGRLLAGLPEEPDARAAALAEERKLATELAQQLLPAHVIERVRSWRGVTVSGLDVLGPVALGWLPLRDTPHLGLARALDTLPSIPFGVARARLLESTPAAADSELLLVGGVQPSKAARILDAELEKLPLTAQTAAALARSYETHVELKDERATAANVLEQLPKYSVVQMLVHAVLDGQHTPPSGLVLEGDGEDAGILWGEALSSRRFAGGATRLVVLAACRSAQGPLRRGDAGSADLAGAWLAAGVPTVLVSHSDLTWGPMVELSTAFHTHLRAEACSPAEALRRALAGREIKDARELPFRYGLLEVVGLGQQPIFAASPR